MATEKKKTLVNQTNEPVRAVISGTGRILLSGVELSSRRMQMQS
jgi:hypothetical protein